MTKQSVFLYPTVMIAIGMSSNVSANGNIVAHYREAVVIPINYQDDSGVDVDLSNSTLMFEIQGVLRKQLATNPDDPMGKLLTLTRSELADVPRTGAKFVLIDETNTYPMLLWEGFIVLRGWIDAQHN